MRYIDLTITNEYVKGTGEFVGCAGSHDDVAFRMTFGDMWDGLAKTIVWRNAYRENPTFTVVTPAMLEDPEANNVYVVPIPVEAKEFPGNMGMTIKGVATDGSLETQATLTVYGEFPVKESYWSDDAEESADVTATQAAQLQSQIETLTDAMLAAQHEAHVVRQEWSLVEAEAETLPAGSDATARAEDTDRSVKFVFGIPSGRDGVATTADGMFAFNINDQGHLILTYVDDEDLEFSINEQGHLIVTINV